MTTAIGTNPVEISNRALGLLGQKPIDSFEDGTDKSQTCGTVWPVVRLEVLSHYPWRFMMAKRQLARLTAAPTNEWQHAFQLPSDRFQSAVVCYDSAEVDAVPLLDWDHFGEYVFANVEALWIDYPANRDEDKWPPHVVTLATFVMAARIAFGITDDGDKAEYWQKIAYGTAQEGQRGGFSRQARAQDAQRRPAQIVHDFSLIRVRSAGAG